MPVGFRFAVFTRQIFLAAHVSVRTLCFCYLEASHDIPPIVAPDSRNASRSLRRTRQSLPVGFNARRRPLDTIRSTYRGVVCRYSAACCFVRTAQLAAPASDCFSPPCFGITTVLLWCALALHG